MSEWDYEPENITFDEPVQPPLPGDDLLYGFAVEQHAIPGQQAQTQIPLYQPQQGAAQQAEIPLYQPQQGAAQQAEIPLYQPQQGAAQQAEIPLYQPQQGAAQQAEIPLYQPQQGAAQLPIYELKQQPIYESKYADPTAREEKYEIQAQPEQPAFPEDDSKAELMAFAQRLDFDRKRLADLIQSGEIQDLNAPLLPSVMGSMQNPLLRWMFQNPQGPEATLPLPPSVPGRDYLVTDNFGKYLFMLPNDEMHEEPTNITKTWLARDFGAKKMEAGGKKYIRHLKAEGLFDRAQPFDATGIVKYPNLVGELFDMDNDSRQFLKKVIQAAQYNTPQLLRAYYNADEELNEMV